MENDEINEQEPAAEKQRSFFREQLLLFIQTAVCILFIAAALIIKAVGGTVYSNTATFFFDNYYDTVFTAADTAAKFFTDEANIRETSHITFPADDSQKPESSGEQQ